MIFFIEEADFAACTNKPQHEPDEVHTEPSAMFMACQRGKMELKQPFSINVYSDLVILS